MRVLLVYLAICALVVVLLAKGGVLHHPQPHDPQAAPAEYDNMIGALA